MLNFMSSSIDDVQMDQASLFRIFQTLRSEENLFLNRFLSLSPNQGGFLERFSENQTAIGTYTAQTAGGSSTLCLQALSVMNELKN